MLRTAGEVADGCIINWLAVEDVKKSVAVVREAATMAGRDPDAIEITARIMVCVDPVSPEADTGRRRHINAYLNVPVYKAFTSGSAAVMPCAHVASGMPVTGVGCRRHPKRSEPVTAGTAEETLTSGDTWKRGWTCLSPP
jgi:alkanesulfonate monooxygenase SsuD/methylene tetrahydromethanopterin reductase-like flavin-dependent oxidoreductase (luciferase family)